MVLTIGAMIGTSMIAQSIPYQEGIGAKQLAWAVHCGVVGAVIAPLCIVGGPLLLRAALYTAGIAGGLSAIAYCAPNDKFLYMGGPLAIGLGAVFAASIGKCRRFMHSISHLNVCYYFTRRFRVFAPHHRSRGIALLGRIVRGSAPLQRLPPLRHPANCTQGGDAPHLQHDSL